jgi:hypothetical protein
VLETWPSRLKRVERFSWVWIVVARSGAWAVAVASAEAARKRVLVRIFDGFEEVVVGGDGIGEVVRLLILIVVLDDDPKAISWTFPTSYISMNSSTACLRSSSPAKRCRPRDVALLQTPKAVCLAR